MADRTERDSENRFEQILGNVTPDEFFHQITTRICGDLDISQALWKCHLYLEKIVPLDRITLAIWDWENNVIQRVAYSTSSSGSMCNQRVSIPEEAMKLLEEESRSQLEKIINPLNPSDKLTQLLAPYIELQDASDLRITLKIGNKRLGGLILRARGQTPYRAEHARLLSLVREPFSIALSNALAHKDALKLKNQLAEENRFLHQERKKLYGELIGAEGGLSPVMEMVHQVAPLSNTLLLLGETGVGKEVIAEAIHRSSPRKDAPFIKVNCGAIPDTLIDSELFGHEKGAFTGAVAQRRGHFERAQGGTLFLDEIGELPPAVQTRLLRVIQSREIERVGGSRTIPVNIRIIAATHRDLEAMVRQNRFREDLWFRLNVFPILIPPLRQRTGDIPELVRHFCRKKSKELGLHQPLEITAEALDRLCRYSWPGNVRELENVIERELIRAQGGELRFGDLPLDAGAASDLTEGFQTLLEVETMQIEETLRRCGGKVHGPDGAASKLGLNPSTLRNRMNKLGIRYGRKLSPP